MGDPTASSSAFAELTNMLLDMGEGDTPADRYMSDAAWDYIAKFIDNIDGIVLSSSSQVYKNVIAGEYAVGVPTRTRCAGHHRQQGQPRR